VEKEDNPHSPVASSLRSTTSAFEHGTPSREAKRRPFL